mmetsp:Transcript_41260/g.96657  ORF Transcript_41260/g.96657 Transcript_41260/m.96657 type:complete len:224 (-) Transcript_41260:1195-1866(-)
MRSRSSGGVGRSGSICSTMPGCACSRTKAARSQSASCSALWPLPNRSLSSSPVIRSRIWASSPSSASRDGPSPTSSACSRARVSGLRSSWLRASNSARLPSRMAWMSAAIWLKRIARSPISSRWMTGTRCENSPRRKASAPSTSACSGCTTWRIIANATPVTSSSAGNAHSRPKRPCIELHRMTLLAQASTTKTTISRAPSECLNCLRCRCQRWCQRWRIRQR